MEKLKKLGIAEALVGLFTFTLLLGFVLFFFIYDSNAISSYEDPNQDLEGIGNAVILVFFIICMFCFIPSGILYILSFAGQFALLNKKGYSVAFAVVGMIGKILAFAILLFMCLFIGEPMIGVPSAIAYITVATLTLFSFGWSIAGLVLCKKLA